MSVSGGLPCTVLLWSTHVLLFATPPRDQVTTRTTAPTTLKPIFQTLPLNPKENISSCFGRAELVNHIKINFRTCVVASMDGFRDSSPEKQAIHANRNSFREPSLNNGMLPHLGRCLHPEKLGSWTWGCKVFMTRVLKRVAGGNF